MESDPGISDLYNGSKVPDPGIASSPPPPAILMSLHYSLQNLWVLGILIIVPYICSISLFFAEIDQLGAVRYSDKDTYARYGRLRSFFIVFQNPPKTVSRANSSASSSDSSSDNSDKKS